MSAPGASPRTPTGPDGRTALVDRILTLLHYALTDWELPPHRWEKLGSAVETLIAAEAQGGEEEALCRTLVQLQLAAPDRVVPIGSVRPVRVSARHRERMNHLIHTLTPPEPPTAAPAPRSAPPDDRR
ncbi:MULTISPECIES: CATRA system-associated protein [unclassified Streptomyces]|uniref:CATRA system-associated protein n=1 Tax=unclassified Streptomyces TaxID=2593676 RepID=UPI002E1497F8|nr:hypothetical protein OG457_30710 [Streptomyces sp. NBC_01207]WTA20964.1 hypothetical protein OG365_24615 [Streptomyces sp. NBC_00853]